jgi:hypothetical protein
MQFKAHPPTLLTYPFFLLYLSVCFVLPLSVCGNDTNFQGQPLHRNIISIIRSASHMSPDVITNVTFGLAAVFLTLLMIGQAAQYAARQARSGGWEPLRSLLHKEADQNRTRLELHDLRND